MQHACITVAVIVIVAGVTSTPRLSQHPPSLLLPFSTAFRSSYSLVDDLDPLSLACTVITISTFLKDLIELAQALKSSVEKVRFFCLKFSVKL